MVAFCAIYIVQSIKHPSDWSLFRLATLQELVAELSKQAADRYPVYSDERLTVVDAMARQLSRAIKLVLSRIRLSMAAAPRAWESISPAQDEPQQTPALRHFELDHLFSDTLPEWGLPDISPNLAVPMFDFNQCVWGEQLADKAGSHHFWRCRTLDDDRYSPSDSRKGATSSVRHHIGDTIR